MKLSSHLIIIFCFTVIIDHSTPSINGIVFSIGKPFHQKPFISLPFCWVFVFLAKVKRSFGVCIDQMFIINFRFSYLTQELSSFVWTWINSKVMKETNFRVFWFIGFLHSFHSKLREEDAWLSCHSKKK